MSPFTRDPDWSSMNSVAKMGPSMVPFTTRCDTRISPSMRAFSLSTSVEDCSASAVTLPLISPSTRSPPLKLTLPSIFVPVPIRLSMRFCGLLGCFANMDVSPRVLLRQIHALDCSRLAGALLENPYLDRLDLHLAGHSEGAFHA